MLEFHDGGLLLLRHEDIAVKSENGYTYADSFIPTGDALLSPFFTVPCPVCGEPLWVMGKVERVLPETFETRKKKVYFDDTDRERPVLTEQQAREWFFHVLRKYPSVYAVKGVKLKTEIVGDVVSIRLEQNKYYRHSTSYSYSGRSHYSSPPTPSWSHQCDPAKTLWLHRFSTAEAMGNDLYEIFSKTDELPGEYHASSYKTAGERLLGGRPTQEQCAYLAGRLLVGDEVHPAFRLAREPGGVWPHLAWAMAPALFEPDKEVKIPEAVKLYEENYFRQRAGNWDRLFGGCEYVAG